MKRLVFSEEELAILINGLGWLVAEGAYTSEEVIDLAVRLGKDRQEWLDTYGPFGGE